MKDKEHVCCDCGKIFPERKDEYGDIEKEICLVCEMQRLDGQLDDREMGDS